MLYLGTILYVGLLFVNAIAILSEERFLARSSSPPLRRVFEIYLTMRAYTLQSAGHLPNSSQVHITRAMTSPDTAVLVGRMSA